MRFAAASTVLASTLPGIVRPLGVVQAHVDHEDLLQSNLYKRVSERKILSKKTATSQRRHAGRGRLLKTLMSDGGYGSNECNPDVGLLACGFGQFCDGSLDSALGGTCVSLPRFERRLQTDFGQANASVAPSDPTDSEISSPITSSPVTGNTSQTISPTLGNATDVSPASGPWVYCDPSSPFYGNLECECQEWSIENQTGSIICKLKPETCDEECENTCYSIDFHYISNGSDFSYRYCYQFVQPIEQQFCFGYSNDRTCLLSLDDTICSSCYTSYRLNCNYGSCYSQACSNFDCENAALGQGNSCYDPVVPPAFYDCYRELNDLYPSCALCSSDDIDYPEEYLDLPGYGSFNCSYIDSLARIGLLNPQQCTYATVLSATTCCQRDDVPVFKCNLCGQESHVITNVNAVINLPGQPSISCGDFQALAVQGQIEASQCGIVQGFVSQACGCMHSEDVAPTTSPGEIGQNAGTSNMASGDPRCLLSSRATLSTLLSIISVMTLTFLIE